MYPLRPMVERDKPANIRYLEAREKAFVLMLLIFDRIILRDKSIDKLPELAKNYSKFLSVSDREPFLEAIDKFVDKISNPQYKEHIWAQILAIIMRSGTTRCDIKKSPGLDEVRRLVTFSPFCNHKVIAYVTSWEIISPSEVLDHRAHHRDYNMVRRMICDVITKMDGADLSMGAEYFIAGRIWRITGFFDRWDDNKPYIQKIMNAIDRRG